MSRFRDEARAVLHSDDHADRTAASALRAPTIVVPAVVSAARIPGLIPRGPRLTELIMHAVNDQEAL